MKNNTQGLLHLIGTWRAEWIKDASPSRASFSRKPIIMSAIAILGLLWLASTASAVTRTWTGAAGSDWHDNNNWNPSGEPASSDDVVIPNSGVTINPIATGPPITIHNLTIESMRTLFIDVGHTLNLTGDTTNDGTLDKACVNGSGCAPTGNLNFSGAIFTNNGTVTRFLSLDFSGSGAQSFAGTGMWTAQQITIDSSSNASIANAMTLAPQDLSVNGTLTVNNPLTISKNPCCGIGPNATNNGMISISSTLTYITDNQSNSFINSSGGVISGSGLFQAQGSDPPFHMAYIDNRGTFDVALKVSGSVANGGARVFNSATNTTVFGHPITVDSGATLRITSFQTLVANDNITVNGTLDDEISTLTFNAVTFTNNGAVKLSKLNFNRTGAQTIAGTGTWTTSGNNTCDISVGISSNTMLANSVSLPSSGTLTVKGTLDQGSSSNLAAGPINIPSGGFLKAHGTSSLTLAGDVTNNGQMSINGGTAACGEPDTILIRSSVAGTPRTWSGSGTFALIDVDVKDQTAGNPPGTINVASGTDSGNNTNWVFGGCIATAAPATISGQVISSDGTPLGGVVLSLNGSRRTITNSNGFYSFADVDTGNFYAVTPFRVNYSFTPNTRAFSLLADKTDAIFTATPDAIETANPLDTDMFFVRQQYLDFLGREPDPPGLAGWTGTIDNCSGDTTQCDRIHVSQLFFQSAEFQQRGYFVYRFYPVSFGRKPDYAEFVPDLASVSGFLDANQLEAAKVQFITNFLARPSFANKYNSLSNQQYVDALLNTAAVTLSSRQAMIDGLNNSTLTRALVLRQIAESAEVSQKYFNQAYAVLEYFGYLRRDPDALYLNWIDVLNANPADSRHMVEGFVNSTEYRRRFGP